MMKCLKTKSILKIISILIVFLFSSNLYSQKIKFRATKFSHRSIVLKNESYIWEKWSEWSKNGTVYLFDDDNKRVRVYARGRKDYDMVAYEKKNDEEHHWLCLDNEGNEVRIEIKIKKMKNGKNHIQLYQRESTTEFTFILDYLKSE